MVNDRNEGTCLTRCLGAPFSCAKSATSLNYTCKLLQNSALTPSGGRPMTAFTPFETIGRSIRIGFRPWIGSVFQLILPILALVPYKFSPFAA